MGILGAVVGSEKRDRKRKPDELLSSVVRETAIPAAVELLRENTRFVFPSGTAWVMLALPADAIGGLSKRHGRDEAKGSIIELIGSDQIKTVATGEMLESEVFGIIPNEETLSRMEEYSLLTGAEYEWAVVWQKPSGDLLVDLVGETTLARAKAVATGALTLEEAIGARAWSEHSGVDTEIEAGSDTTEHEDIDAIFDPIDDEGLVDSAEGEPVFDTEDGPDFDEDFEFDDGVVTEAAAAVEPESGFNETAGFEELDDADIEEQGAVEVGVQLATQDQAREVIARRFLSEDLDLDIRLDEFNASFAIGAPVVQIDVPQGATEWLGDQIAQLARQANADLAQLRAAHEDELRALYVNLMSVHAEKVILNVAMDRDGGKYKQLKDAMEAEHEGRRAQKERLTLERRAAIVKDYEEQARRVAEQAAIQAEIAFKERNRSRMDREKIDAVAQIDRDIEDTYTHDRQEILRVRRSEAALKMQVGMTQIFGLLAEKQKEFLTLEEARLDKWTAEIGRIVDDNRKADIARADALTEHHKTTDEVGILRRKQDELLEGVRAEHASRIRRMEEELERGRKEAATNIAIHDTEWRHCLDLEREKTKAQTERVADLLLQLGAIEDSVERRFTARVTELETDKETYADQLDRASRIHGRSNQVQIALIVVLSLLLLAVGFIVGSALG